MDRPTCRQRPTYWQRLVANGGAMPAQSGELAAVAGGFAGMAVGASLSEGVRLLLIIGGAAGGPLALGVAVALWTLLDPTDRRPTHRPTTDPRDD